MKELSIQTTQPYPIYFSKNLLNDSSFAEFLRQKKSRLAIITDSNLENSIAAQVVNYLRKHQMLVEIFSFPAGETNKTRETKQALEDHLCNKKFSRDTCIIAVGGGVVTDMAGFVAATYCRGVDVIYIPTSLLAMVDASIGGKTGVNTPYGKNLIGCFYQPKAVFIDIGFLKTLPEIEFKNGYVEILKHMLIADAALFAQQHIVDIEVLIFQSCAIKKHIVEQDEREQSLRALLNFGHTIGHAIEVLENYEIRHGEAVAIGIMLESYLSYRMDFLTRVDFDKIVTAVKAIKLPLATKAFQDREKFKIVLKMDKKSQAQQAKYVLLDAIGIPHNENGTYTMPVPEHILDEAFDWFEERLAK
ncbi:MAG: aroB [Gammaproteobacteria bacterium]|jgi:3-dehydroquinate synthase|nr:aroB [Gammaproteobacteria bacterium]